MDRNQSVGEARAEDSIKAPPGDTTVRAERRKRGMGVRLTALVVDSRMTDEEAAEEGGAASLVRLLGDLGVRCSVHSFRADAQGAGGGLDAARLRQVLRESSAGLVWMGCEALKSGGDLVLDWSWEEVTMAAAATTALLLRSSSHCQVEGLRATADGGGGVRSRAGSEYEGREQRSDEGGGQGSEDGQAGGGGAGEEGECEGARAGTTAGEGVGTEAGAGAESGGSVSGDGRRGSMAVPVSVARFDLADLEDEAGDPGLADEGDVYVDALSPAGASPPGGDVPPMTASVPQELERPCSPERSDSRPGEARVPHAAAAEESREAGAWPEKMATEACMDESEQERGGREGGERAGGLAEAGAENGRGCSLELLAALQRQRVVEVSPLERWVYLGEAEGSAGERLRFGRSKATQIVGWEALLAGDGRGDAGVRGKVLLLRQAVPGEVARMVVEAGVAAVVMPKAGAQSVEEEVRRRCLAELLRLLAAGRSPALAVAQANGLLLAPPFVCVC